MIPAGPGGQTQNTRGEKRKEGNRRRLTLATPHLLFFLCGRSRSGERVRSHPFSSFSRSIAGWIEPRGILAWVALNRRIGAQCARGKERGTQGIDRLEIVPICCTLFGVFGPRSLSALRRTSKLRLLSSLLVFPPHDLPSICFRLMCEYKIKISILFSSFSLFAHTQNDAFLLWKNFCSSDHRNRDLCGLWTRFAAGSIFSLWYGER